MYVCMSVHVPISLSLSLSLSPSPSLSLSGHILPPSGVIFMTDHNIDPSLAVHWPLPFLVGSFPALLVSLGGLRVFPLGVFRAGLGRSWLGSVVLPLRLSPGSSSSPLDRVPSLPPLGRASFEALSVMSEKHPRNLLNEFSLSVKHYL